MYCQKCGKQIADGSTFCQHCGAQTGNVVSDNFSNQNYNVQHTERKPERIKSKEEFLADYRAKHPERIVYMVLFIICIIVSSIVFIMNGLEFVDHHRNENLTGMLISVFIDIGAIGFAVAMKKVDSSAEKAFNNYITQESRENVSKNRTWLCPKCGNSNPSNMRYCSNCSCQKPNFNPISAQTDVWQCPKCGKINQNYVGTCGCGEVKPK